MKKQSPKNLKLVVGYPPIPSEKGVPLLSQNRQFQYFNAKTFIYPMVPASAATLAQDQGYQVKWMDGIAGEQTLTDWTKELKKFQPDFLLLETKAPVIKRHWLLIDDLKRQLPKLKIVLVGDHVTFLPGESLDNCLVDYIITGGDYDFVMINLLNHISRGEKLESGVWWRSKDKNITCPKPKKFKGKKGAIYFNSGLPSLGHDLNDLPFVDRDLTKWRLYAYFNGNFKYHPGTYTFSGRDCWWNRCTFCIWDQTLYPRGSYRTVKPERLFEEVKILVDQYGVKEIFDDAGTFMVGSNLRKFCHLMIDSGYSKKVVLSCNMRLNALNQKDYDLMGRANFRFILYGMESANQKTLDKLDKGLKVAQIKQGVKMAKQAGLEPHLTIMLGYPWEDYADALNTIKLAKECVEAGWVDTLQTTIIIPYPGSALWKECQQKGWLLTENYEDYDMRQPVMKTSLTADEILKLTRLLYSSLITPKFMWRRVIGMRSWADLKFNFFATWKFLSHLFDFSGKKK
ncbi:MAG: radical SAM protein [Patescibacteria group bacterium]|nr:B12-binding domain-containing radical SAM protein [Patescibacteria group bacterium]